MKILCLIFAALALPAASSAQEKTTTYKRNPANDKLERQFKPGDKGETVTGLIERDQAELEAVNKLQAQMRKLKELYGDDTQLGPYEIPGAESCQLSTLAYDEAMACLRRQQSLSRAVAGSAETTGRKREQTVGAAAADGHEKSSVDFAH